ncbi:MAG: hypothetical protein A2018_07455 [Alphaproteobacteria bacterium GWF2_58_20]|nr:MAG: hypothetical protein A2018_07455 [Alphaproteobacteria bacterium GWF2_58_20]
MGDTNMFWKSKLASWEEAGLITHETADAIRVQEASTASRHFGRSIVLLGLFAILLGILAIISANWNVIPDTVKIGGHFLFLNVVSAAFLQISATRNTSPLRVDAALFFFWGTLLSFMALIGQVYNIHSDPLRTIAFWTALSTPIILTLGQGRFIASAWLFALVASFSNLADYLGGFTSPYFPEPFLLWLLPLALISLGQLPVFSLWRKNFGEIFLAWGVMTFALIVLAAQFIWYENDITPIFVRDHDSITSLFRIFVACFMLATSALPASLLFLRERKNALPWLAYLSGGAILALLPICLSLVVHGAVISAIMFILACLGMAWFGIRTGLGHLASAAILLIAVRLIIIYFELFGSLMNTGFSLILGGILAILVARLAIRIRQRIVPCAIKS